MNEQDITNAVKSVLDQMKAAPAADKPHVCKCKKHRMTLAAANALIEKVKAKAAEMGVDIVAAVSDKAGRPVAVQCMDGAYIASFDIALNKTYTSASREEILKVHAKKVRLDESVDFQAIARMASGASGAELANIVNEAALRAVRQNRNFVTQADLEESIEVVIAGYQKKNAILTDQEKKVVAYHEIGHALVAAMQSHSAPVQKITIVPRTSGALGYTMQVEEGNHYLMSQEELENKIATLTGGRAAEELVFHSASTGASNDIEQATKLARAMITRYGMSKDFDMVAMETVTNQYLGGDTSLSCSAETQTEIDRQVVELVKKQHEKADRILAENRDKLDKLADYLYEKETITGEEFMEILRSEP